MLTIPTSKVHLCIPIVVYSITFVLFRMDVHKNKDELGPVIFCTKEAEELEKMARSPKSGCSCSGM